jgi:2-(1,2-epoxy-1,2-dihydrophenyl)acetyl-CoA isomerase
MSEDLRAPGKDGCMSEDLLQELSPEGVLRLTLNRPATLNSLGGSMIPDLIGALYEANEDRRVRCIVLTGAGRGFCSGADVSFGGPNSNPAERPVNFEIERRVGQAGAVVLAMAESRVPIIGAINGPAAGAGFGLALCCDVRIASDRARMGTIFIKRGLSSDYGVGYWLPLLVGPARAFELLYSGDLLDAQALLSLGLVNRVVPHDTLLDEAMAYAGMIAAGPADAYTSIRHNVIAGSGVDLVAFLEQEWQAQTRALVSEDAREGFAAFREKRAPRFRAQ